MNTQNDVDIHIAADAEERRVARGCFYFYHVILINFFKVCIFGPVSQVTHFASVNCINSTL
jgi:hypothetical protein